MVSKKLLFLLSICVLVLFILGCGAESTVDTADFPNQEIRIIVPWNAGGANDVMARHIQSIFSERDIDVVVENVPGGGSAVGLAELISSEPDGHTVAVGTSSSLGLMALDQIDISNDEFANIALMSEDPLVLVTSKGADWDNVEDFMNDLEADPESIQIGVPGTNNVNHMMAELIGLAADLKPEVTSFDGGSRVITEVLGGHIDAGVLKVSESIHQDELVELAVFQEERLEALPDVHTLTEHGYDIFQYGNVTQISYIISSADVDPEIQERLEALFTDVIVSDEYQKLAEQNEFMSDGTSGQELDEKVQEITNAFQEIGPDVFTDLD